MAEIIQFSVIILGCKLSAVALFRIESDAEMATRAVNCDVLVYLALQSRHSDTITAFCSPGSTFFCHFGRTKGLIKDAFQREVDTKQAHTHTFIISERGLCSCEYIFFAAKPTNTLFLLKHKMHLNADLHFSLVSLYFPSRLHKE